MKDQGLEVVEEEILTQSYIERVDAITLTAPTRIQSSNTGSKRSVSKVLILSNSIEDGALFYLSNSSTGEPRPVPRSPPRSGQQPFVMRNSRWRKTTFQLIRRMTYCLLWRKRKLHLLGRKRKRRLT